MQDTSWPHLGRRSLATALILCLALEGLPSPLSQAAQPAHPDMAAQLVIDPNPGEFRISRHIYGHFAEHLGGCIYGGLWVGEDSEIPNIRGLRTDAIEALRRLNIPNLRWPGGCFADQYHWRDGIGPKAERPKRINVFWGGVIEDNSFGTHEFLDLCELLGTDAYIAGNVGSGTPQEMAEWLEYLTFDGDSAMADLRRENGRQQPWRIPFWGVGNENWGCGGDMRPEYYADVYRNFASYCRSFSGNRMMKVACGSNGPDYRWTEVLMDRAARHMDALSLHYYTVGDSWSHKLPATGFAQDDWFLILRHALRMDEIITITSTIMDRFDPQGRVALFVDEWGTWYQAEPGTNPAFLYQQNTVRDALVAGITLNTFHKHCERVRMANIAQTVNVLQAMLLTRGPEMLLTPTYHVYEMYKVHQDAHLLPFELVTPEYTFGEESIPMLSASASKSDQAIIHVSLCNLDPNRATPIACSLQGNTIQTATGRVLSGDSIDAHNSFEEPNRVEPRPLEGIRIEGDTLWVTLPAHSVALLTIQND
jgi:alpha-N-arabinofuranosidase